MEEEFLQRIQKHKGIVYKICKMYCQNVHEQDDLFQEIMYQVWKSYPTFRGESTFSTWLYRIALNTSIFHFKKEKKAASKPNEKEQCIADEIEETYTENREHLVTEMYQAIQQLNAIERAILFYYLEGFSGQEIAKEVGLTEGNIRVKMNRIKEKLRKLVTK